MYEYKFLFFFKGHLDGLMDIVGMAIIPTNNVCPMFGSNAVLCKE